MKKINTKTLVLISLFAAASIILTRFLSVYVTTSARISLGNVPVFLAGFLFGPLAGAFTGAVADILGASLFSPFGWYPPLTIPATLTGIISGLLKPIFLKKASLWKIYALIGLSNLITEVLVKTKLLAIMYGTGFFQLLPLRVPLILLVTVLEGLALFLLYNRMLKHLVH